LILAEVSIVPLGEGTSVGKFVKAAIRALRESGVRILVGPMSTTIEVKNLLELNVALSSAHEAMFSLGAKRVVTSIKIDDRRDKEVTIGSKLADVNQNH